MPNVIDADLCVIGAGAAGLSVAAGAAQLGRKVVLVEKGKMGGDCLNYGCVPSKALLAAAARAQAMRDGGKFGVYGEPTVDFPAVMAHVRAAVAAIAPHDSQERFEGLGATVIREAGAFVGPRALAAGEHEIRAKHFVVATGSSPAVPPIPGLEAAPYLTNETVFDLDALPGHLVIVGGGPIGCELGQAFRRLGARVTIIDALEILNREDPEAVGLLRARLDAEGVALRERAKIARIDARAGAVSVALEGGETVEGSHLLLAVGRRANVDGLGLEAAGVAYTDKGIVVDDRLRTSNRRIYAAGDVAGGPQFTHLAGDHASTIVRNILFKMPARRRDRLAPRATYTDPEIAAVGLSEEEAAKDHPGARSARWRFADNDRAQTEGRTEGFLKLVADQRGRILGASAAGAGAAEAIGLVCFAMADKMSMRAFTNVMPAYPTRGEIVKRAAGAWYAPALFSDRTRLLVRLLALFD
ncbi:dihydrolipoyl dehydrogenase family protein [Amphiplicatus metriothermophilus]|uniref:Pyruvate/2-oxoglutarate dehydrogenase complex, dihydrolipoamide dehydrogenase (E3) component n=1 Tax=Amphiplicatus metriothermophilus TaxID=1519374 RepID=A0A239PJV7_9PROT|nr:FAD-dependent oxidoreductase [Amphiplicatus metriothermophilus]MBB5518053.1 pyruvate/2-oxoglutarate dehydrogenase complex dihydrolipoamide dehydrogenase (E3) component [Amphiplicatus metriothermophilus]SNT67613.1 Pyruvate/2-oxoglutarate dehydrogenase complex, dihydrolipoamide dehydrogenase (E3) component [Amphiplicatus metriothermophilus]